MPAESNELYFVSSEEALERHGLDLTYSQSIAHFALVFNTLDARIVFEPPINKIQ